MTPQEWIWAVFVFALGCCIGSFLNVVIYRLPRDKSLVSPGSACPRCGKPIRFYDNIPLVSWIVLRAKCRNCKEPISARYFIVELLTGSVFLGLYIIYFDMSLRPVLHSVQGGWFVYVLHLILLSAFIAASGIDLELWIIPLSICWFVTAVGLVGSSVASYAIHPADVIAECKLLPVASAKTAALAVGATVGLGISLLLLRTGLLKRSYESASLDAHDRLAAGKDSPDASVPAAPGACAESQFNDRLEALREIVFLLPIIVCAIVALTIVRRPGPVARWWSDLLVHPVAGGFFGSLFGYFVGCGVVWATRILGTLAFGREAMGLGDVHLMGAAGAVIGPLMVVIAFFIAPFFGLGWALFQMIFKKTRQIPYGPFLSLAVFAIMIFHDWILDRIALTLYW
ncbi:MAG: prepilin peptidase [Sedimentisphaerales bacterium]|nr:prepilin peptidase [Sedimentisphaerales bacterium]